MNSNLLQKSVLFVLKVPPPVHGSTLMNNTVYEYFKPKLPSSSFFTMSISSDGEDIGRFRLSKFVKVLNYYIKFIVLLSKKKFDLVYFALSPFSFAFFKDLIFVSLVKLFGIPIVYHLHVKGVKGMYDKSFLYKILYSFVFSNERIILLSENLKDDVAMFSFKDVTVISNGIDELVESQFVYDILPLRSNRQPHLLFLSNFIETKGVWQFLYLCKLLKEEGVNFKFSLIGKPVDVSIESVQRYIIDSDLSNYLDFLGPAYGEVKLKYFLDSSIFIFPTYYSGECVPLVLIEAMQCGLPIVTSDEGGISSLVENNVNGIIVNPKDVSDIKNALMRLIYDTKLQVTMGEESRRRYDSFFTKEVFVSNLASYLNIVLDEGK